MYRILYLYISFIIAKIHDCGEWSNWLTFEDLTEEMINNYEIILNNESNEICDIFSLEQYIQKEEIVKGFKMSIIKTAGIASCLGLTFAIGAIIIYSKTNNSSNQSIEN